MYEECPAWADIRNKFPQAFDARLLTCTRLMGIACLEQSTIDVMRSLHLQANNVPPGSVRQLDAASASTQPPVAVSACIACFTFHAFHPIWRRVGFSIRCTARNSDVDLALPLHGPEQCSIRAGALALCLLLEREPRPLRVLVVSLGLQSFWQVVSSGSPLPFDADNLDLLQRARHLLRSRSTTVSLVQLQDPKRCVTYQSALVAARQAALVHHDAAFLAAKSRYDSLSSAVFARQQMLLAIVLARGKLAKQRKLLTFADSKRPFHPDGHLPPALGSSASLPDYPVHPPNFSGFCFSLGPFKPFSRALRFMPGEYMYAAMCWYLSSLRWPDLPLADTRGVTYLELTIDFELSTGIALPGGTKRLHQQNNRSIRRGAAQTIRSVFEPAISEEFLSHDIIRISTRKKPARYSCKVCGRSGLWCDRTKFLSYSCAGRPETMSEAVRRHRLAAQRRKLAQLQAPEASLPPLNERALFFSDCFRSVITKNASQFDILEHACLVCRALAGFGLPPSAGLLHRPILLHQSRVTDEIKLAASRFLAASDASSSSSHWHSNWFPSYDALDLRPRPLWRPREPD